MNTKRAAFVGFCHRFTYAALLSALVWIGAHLPLPEGTYPPTKLGARNTIVRWLDLPIAAATQALPCDEFAIDLWFTVDGGEPCPFSARPTEFFLNHMRLGIPVYMLIFYLPAIYRGGRERWVRRRGPTSARSSVAART